MFQKSGPEASTTPTPTPTQAARPPSEPPAATAPPRPAVPDGAAPLRGASEAPSVIGLDVSIRGGIEGRGAMQLQGRAWGDVKVESLFVGESAALEGSVVAHTVEIRGRVVGSIDARTVRLLPSAVVEGDITYEMLQIEPGATFEGRCIKAKAQVAPGSSAPVDARRT